MRDKMKNFLMINYDIYHVKNIFNLIEFKIILN